jgi:hypothetical protein
VTSWVARRLPRRGCAIDPGNVAAGERGVPDVATGGRGDAIGPGTTRRVEDLNPSTGRIQPAVDAGLAGEPEDAVPIERRRVQVGVPPVRRQREDLDASRSGVDADDRVQPTVGDPRRPVGPDDDAVRCGSGSEPGLVDGAGRGIEVAEGAVLLARVPDAAVGGGGDVVRVAPGGNRELHELEGSRRTGWRSGARQRCRWCGCGAPNQRYRGEAGAQERSHRLSVPPALLRAAPRPRIRAVAGWA